MAFEELKQRHAAGDSGKTVWRSCLLTLGTRR
jgi:hypothetical protein